MTKDKKVVTRRSDQAILRGITRQVLFETLKAEKPAVDERPFTLEEAYAAREAFVSSATQIVVPVIQIDGRKIGDGKPGPIATALRREFHRFAEARPQLGLASPCAVPSNKFARPHRLVPTGGVKLWAEVSNPTFLAEVTTL